MDNKTTKTTAAVSAETRPPVGNINDTAETRLTNSIQELTDCRDTVNKWMERFGVRFGIYKNNTFKEQLFPFDSVPRVIPNEQWKFLERGLEQRVRALNLFLWDVYHEKHIISDGIVPEDFVYASSGYNPLCEGIDPKNGIYSHISGIDLVEGKDGNWYIQKSV